MCLLLTDELPEVRSSMLPYPPLSNGLVIPVFHGPSEGPTQWERPCLLRIRRHRFPSKGFQSVSSPGESPLVTHGGDNMKAVETTSPERPDSKREWNRTARDLGGVLVNNRF